MSIIRNGEEYTPSSPNIKMGYVDSSLLGSVVANAVTTCHVDFDEPFPEDKSVIVTCTLVSTSASSTIGSITAAVGQWSRQGFDINVFNDTSSNRSPGVIWLAVAI